jgi:hypothetical protein
MSLSTLTTNLLVESATKYAKNILGLKHRDIIAVEVLDEFIELGWEFHPDFDAMAVSVVVEYSDEKNDFWCAGLIISDNYEVLHNDSFSITYEWD